MKIRIKYKSCILLVLLSNFIIQAQTAVNLKGAVSGKVLDEKALALPYANITIFDLNKKIIVGGITSENGEFKIEEIPLGKIIIEVSYNSYNTFSKQVILDNSNKKYNVGDIKLQPNSSLLEEVVVVGEKSTFSFKRDKKVFNVGKDVLAQSNSALDVLENIPSVSVDVGGKVSLRGNPNVTVLINGRQSGLTLNNALDQIPAINIESIEVITNPSAKYESTGSAGILNIVLKKNKKEGVNGQVSLRFGYPVDSRIGGSVNYKADKLNFFATVGNRYTDYIGRYTMNQTSSSLGANSALSQVEKENRHDDGILFYGGVDYSFNSKNTLTLAYNINDTKDRDKSEINYDYFTNNQLDNSLIRNGKSRENRSYNQVELNYLKTFDKKGRKFTVDFQYDFWDSTKDWSIITERVAPFTGTIEQLRTNSKNGNKDYVLKTDYVTPVKEKGKLETGLKGEYRNVTNKYLAENFITDEWLIYDGLDNDLDYKETIGAAYMQYGNEFGKFNYLLGLRDEYTSVEIRDVNKIFTKDINYNGLFPTVHLGYDFSEKAGLQLSYSKRITRPSIWDLNPFNEIKDFTYQNVGNPDLNPAYTDAFELAGNKNFEKVTLAASVYYQRTKDFFQNYTFQNGDNSFIVQPINLDLENRHGIEASINYNPIKRLSLFTVFNFYKFSQEGNYGDQNFDFSSQFWQFQFRAQAKLPKDFNVQAFFDFQGENKNAQTVTASIYYLNLSFNKNILSNRMTLAFNATNVLDSRVQKQVTTNQNYLLERDANRNAQRFYITILYRFAEKQFKERYIKESNRN